MSKGRTNGAAPVVLLGGTRWKPALGHLLLSSVVLVLVGAGLFFLWYPPPFATLSGGLKLFGLLAIVDVVLGPLGTLIVSGPKKPRTEWRRDVALIVLLQMVALGYGLWTVYQARPVYLVFEIDRFRVVHAADVPRSLLPQAPGHMQSLPVAGPGLAAVRPFHDRKEWEDATLAALQGLDLGARPDMWMDYGQAAPAVLAAAQPLATLVQRASEADKAAIRKAVAKSGLVEEKIVYLPLASRHAFWTVLLDARSARPVGYVDMDGFGP